MDFDRLPEIMEEIEVLWDLNGRLVWWTADITCIPSTLSTKKSARAEKNARIRYRKMKGYEPVDYDIRFIPPKQGLKRLQHILPSSDDLTPWKYPHENADTAFCHNSASQQFNTRSSEREDISAFQAEM